MYHTLRALKIGSSSTLNRNPIQHRQIRERELYIHQMYNVKTYYTVSPFSRENPMARMVNALVNALNEPTNTYLPRMVIFILDAEFLKMMNYTDYGISMMIGRCFEWFMRRVYWIIDDCREDLKAKRAGAVAHFEPKLIWVKMLEECDKRSALPILKEKFNAILSQVLQQERQGFILDPVLYPLPRGMFDIPRSLSHDGRITYWHSFSEQVRKFDVQEDRDQEFDPHTTTLDTDSTHSAARKKLTF